MPHSTRTTRSLAAWRCRLPCPRLWHRQQQWPAPAARASQQPLPWGSAAPAAQGQAAATSVAAARCTACPGLASHLACCPWGRRTWCCTCLTAQSHWGARILSCCKRRCAGGLLRRRPLKTRSSCRVLPEARCHTIVAPCDPTCTPTTPCIAVPRLRTTWDPRHPMALPTHPIPTR